MQRYRQWSLDHAWLETVGIPLTEWNFGGVCRMSFNGTHTAQPNLLILPYLVNNSSYLPINYQHLCSVSCLACESERWYNQLKSSVPTSIDRFHFTPRSTVLGKNMASPYIPDGLAPLNNGTFTRHLLLARQNVTPNQFRESHRSVPTNSPETNTIIAACVMFVAILIAWNLPILRDIIAGLKVGS
jgi:hypothetical protein